MIVSTGTAIFHHVTVELTVSSVRTASRLSQAKINSNTAQAKNPAIVRRPDVCGWRK